MGVNDLQWCLENTCVAVDLLKIAHNVTQRQQPHNTNRKIRPIGNKLKLIVDAENCLDRLYGGCFSDWTCGGQWSRMVQFLSLLTRAVKRGNIELAVVFNGTIETCRMNEWIIEQANIRQKVGMVLKHINTKATPPPKVWWTPPTCLRSALRMALRHLGVTVMCTMDDHHQEVIAYCREYGFHGLLADDAEYAAFDPPRYFSSKNLKLTYKGSLETKEFMINELTKSLRLTQEELCIMAALLGNFLLPENDLQDFYKRIGFIGNNCNKDKTLQDNNIKILADFVRNLPSPSNMDGLITNVLGCIDDKRASRLRQSVQYYLNGTASGFLKYCAPPVNPKEKQTNVQNHNNSNNNNNNNNKMANSNEDNETNVGFASETTEQEEETLQNYKLATVNLVMSNDYGLESNGTSNSEETGQCNGFINGSTSTTSQTSTPSTGNRVNLLVSSNSSNASNSDPSSPKNSIQNPRPAVSTNLVTPTVSPDVLRTASLRHQKGLMASMILHVLSTQEVRLPCLMEDEGNREFPPIHDIYQPLRQRIYAVLFNLHHLRYVHTKKKESGELPENSPPPDIIVKEWIYSRSNPFQYSEEVKAEPLPWAVPTLQRLWFGPAVDDKRRRMRALLSCLNSDTPLILNTDYVPQHMLIMACVLRYIMSQDKPIMRRHELDAFLCQSFNVDLMNPQYLQELTLNVVTSRGVQLAALFMQGVEMALLANDACGAPLPWLMCCPWLYFDGKLFHHTLNRTVHCKTTLKLCENQIERVFKVERMRKAILEGLDVKFAEVPLPQFPGMIRPGLPPQGVLPMTLPPPPPPTNRMPGSIRPRPIASRGGQLQVAGVVVGSWGPNYSYQQNIRQSAPQQQPPPPSQLIGNFQGNRGRGIITGPGNIGNYQHINYPRGRPHHHQQQQQQQQQQQYHHYHHHQQQQQQQNRKSAGQPIFPVNKRNNANKRKNGNKTNKNQQQQQAHQQQQQQPQKPPTPPTPEHTLTIKTETGDIPADDVIQNISVSTVAGKQEDNNSTNFPLGHDWLQNWVAPDNSNNSDEHKGQGDGPSVVETETSPN